MIGTLLGNRYELLEVIGEGGMATVYKAKCHLLNRFVAVKVLKEQFINDKEFVEKFKREATAVASLSDHNIVNIYDVGSQDKTSYIVMEYVKGKTLKQIILEQKRLNYTKAIDVAIQICRALECAHRNNIIHRDVKPHNILVTEEGVVKVTDFGIAKATSSSTITNTSKVLGSAHYFSPEQAKGSFVDCRSDIYSLGIVLYEMVTGRVPYDAESPVSVALKHIQEPVVPPKQLNEFIPESLNKLILKSIEKEPIKRYQTTRELLIDLQRVQNNANCDIITNNYEEQYTRVMDPIIVEPEEENEMANRNKIPSKKRNIIIFSVAVVIVIAIGGILGFVSVRGGGDKGPGDVFFNNETTVPNIKGLSKDEAKKAVEAKKLKFILAGKEKSDAPEGTVTKCSPEEGKAVKENSEVRVYISGGQTQNTVPDLKDFDLKTAKDTIVNTYNLQVGSIDYEYSDSVAKDCVIRQSPEADSPADKNTKINLVISKGAEIKLSTVPELKTLTIDEAASKLANAKLKLGSKTEVVTQDKTLDGRVISQSIEAQNQVKEGSSVNVSYYVYKESEKKKAIVPNFKDLTLDKAKELAAQSNLKINAIGKDTDIVEKQNVQSGAEVDEGSTIILTVKQGNSQSTPTPTDTSNQQQ